MSRSRASQRKAPTTSKAPTTNSSDPTPDIAMTLDEGELLGESSGESVQFSFSPITREEFQQVLQSHQDYMRKNNPEHDDAEFIEALATYHDQCLKTYDHAVENNFVIVQALNACLKQLVRLDADDSRIPQKHAHLTVDQLIWVAVLTKLHGAEDVDDIVSQYYIHYPELYLAIPELPPLEQGPEASEVMAALYLLDEPELNCLILRHLRLLATLLNQLEREGIPVSTKELFLDTLTQLIPPRTHTELVALSAGDLEVCGDILLGEIMVPELLYAKCDGSNQANVVLKVPENELFSQLFMAVEQLFDQYDQDQAHGFKAEAYQGLDEWGVAHLDPDSYFEASRTDTKDGTELSYKLELFEAPELLPLGLNSLPWIQNIVRLTTTTKPLGKSKARAHTEVSYYVSSLIEYCTDPEIILSIILGERHYLLGDTYDFDIDHLVDVQHKECPLNKLCRKLLNNFIEINNSMGIKPKLKSKKAARELMEQLPMSMIFERLLAYELKHIKAHHSED